MISIPWYGLVVIVGISGMGGFYFGLLIVGLAHSSHQQDNDR